MKMYNFFYTILYSRAVDTRDMGKLIIISSVNIMVIIFMGGEFESNYLISLSLLETPVESSWSSF